MRPPSVKTVRAVVIASIVLTAFHFADNAIAIDTYPAPDWQPDWFYLVVALSWPVFTAIGIAGYRAYRRGDTRRAGVCLVAYSYTGLISLGHFTSGSPSELTTRGVVSVFVDAVVGLVVLGLAVRVVLSESRTAAL
jgi:hypothetical protein